MSGECKGLGDGVGDERRWAAGGRLNPPIGLLGLAMSPRSASHRPKHAVPSIGPAVLAMNSHSQKKVALEKQTSYSSLVIAL